MKAKNVFSGGLVIDFSPDNTSSDTLTSALNATLTTSNGNEMALQNDMGNARVDTAYLPEGYVPVGTCEYGDIIYIVSYNPLTNKSQIGCFPSPERNISTEEVIEGSSKQQISESLFLKPAKVGYNMNEVSTTSAKVILTKKNLNPGDKYIIYTEDIFNEPYITDIGNTDHDYGKFPKYLKIHVISIDNSNKIDYLDSSVVWYDKETLNSRKDYFINEIDKNISNTPDIDSYRNVLSSGYSVFQSKVSGKLALLVELETINSFSCTHNIYKRPNKGLRDGIEYQDYDIYFNINWNTDDANINPSQICLYNQYWSGISEEYKGKALLWWKNKNDKYILGKPNQGEPAVEYTKQIPLAVKSVQDSINWEEVYKKDITRSYLPENSISYEEFKTRASYDNILNNTLKYIKFTQYIADNPDISNMLIKCNYLKEDKGELITDWESANTSNISLSSVIINRIQGIPQEGQYYVNANSVFIQNGQSQYYTSYKDTEIKIYPYEITDDIINNYFHYSISKKFTSISIPVKQIIDTKELTPDISNLIYNYELAPVMPYGILPHLISKGTINFSKIGSGEINITQWKYYNTENTSTITVGFNIFPEENMGVAGITMDFIDNQGIAATYIFDKNSSYSGTFTDQIPLNNSFSNYKLSSKDLAHAGLQDETNGTVYYPINVPEGTIKSIPSLSKDGCMIVNQAGETIKWDGATSKYINDAGTIYSNFLYLVKITVQYCYKNALGEYDTSDTNNFKTFYRWYWTNNMYNDNYYSIDDFKSLPFELGLDVVATYNTKGYKENIQDYFDTSKPLDILNYENNLGTVEKIITSNIDTKVDLGLQDTYNTFSLNPDIINNVDIKAYIGNSYIQNSNSTVTSIKGVHAIDSDILHVERVPIKKEEPSIKFPLNYMSLYNWQSLNYMEDVEQFTENSNIEYINYAGEVVDLNNTTDSSSENHNYINLTKQGNSYICQFKYKSKQYTNYYKYAVQEGITLPLFKPLVYNTQTASKYSILTSNKAEDSRLPYLKNYINFGGHGYAGGSSTEMSEGYEFYLYKYNPDNNEYYQDSSIKRWDGTIDRKERFFYGIPQLSEQPNNCDTGFAVFVPFANVTGSEANYVKIKTLITEVQSDFPLAGSVHDSFCGRFYIQYYGGRIPDLIGNPIQTGFPPAYLVYYNKEENRFYWIELKYLNVDYTIHYSNSNVSNTFANDLLRVLSQVYVKSQEENTDNYIINKDTVFLTPHDTLYTYDILYQTTTKIKQNNINIQGINFDSYLKAVKHGISEEIIDTNITLELKDVFKNNPLQFKLKSGNINMVVQSSKANAVFLTITERGHLLKEAYVEEMYDDVLYYQNDNEQFQPMIGSYINLFNNNNYKFNGVGQLYYSTSGDQNHRYNFSEGWQFKNSVLLPKRKYTEKIGFNTWRDNRSLNINELESWYFYDTQFTGI